PEAAAIARIDGDDGRKLLDDALKRAIELRRRDLERVGRVVASENDAVAVGDETAARHDRCDRDAILLGLQRILAVMPHLQKEKAQYQKAEADEHEDPRTRHADAEVPKLLLGILEFGHVSREERAQMGRVSSGSAGRRCGIKRSVQASGHSAAS